MVPNQISYLDLGLIDYKKAWEIQENHHKKIIKEKLALRDLRGKSKFSGYGQTHSYLFLCEHPHVFTLGKSGKTGNLLVSGDELTRLNTEFYRNNRGGDITYHGPGQLVGYPILDLDNYYTDVHRYLRDLEQTIIFTLMHFGITAGRIKGLTGVWIDPDKQEKARKICSFGIRCSHWVTMHGFAFNVNTDLKYFSYIVPCGIPDAKMTSMEIELGKKISLREVKEVYRKSFSKVFNATLQEASME